MKKEVDCGFSVNEGWFRFRACAIIIKDGCVLMAKNDREPYYYSVGGGVHLHETAEAAVCREVFEETGVHFEVERLQFIHQNFFVATMDNKGQRCHEVAFYYLMKPNKQKIDDHESLTLSGVKEKVCWLPIDKLGDYFVYPTFFKDKLQNLSDNIEQIVTFE